MKLQEIKTMAKNMGITPVSKKKDELVRAIQKAEGNIDCFGTKEVCDQANCLWRGDCSPRIQ
jgi:hypothetical protein